MSNLQRHKDCTMRSEIGNCLAMGGFCTSVSKEICEALQNAYAKGRHSIEVGEEELKGCDKVNKRLSEDAISRQQAIEILCRSRCGERARGCPAHYCPIINEYDNLPSVAPSVTPQPKEGEWQLVDHLWECDCCQYRQNKSKPTNFCPNCGAKMRI